jgi:hypothetical protein
MTARHGKDNVAPARLAPLGAVFRVLARALQPVDARTLRFYLQALREADPSFGKPAGGDESQLSLEWLVRDTRRPTS